MASNDTNQVTIILGDEYDDELRAKLMDVLRRLGGVQRGAVDWAVAGSQELERLEVDVGGRALHVEAETYIGLSITGAEDLVDQVCALLAR